MKRIWLIPIGFVALLAPVAVLAGGGDGGFDSVVRSIESRYHVHATRIPFIGVISLIASRATHEGASNLHIAEFDSLSQPVDGDELSRMVEQKLGPGWERMIRETSRKGQEQTLIYIHPEGKRMGLFVLDADGNELDVVQVSVDPDHLKDNLGHYGHRHREPGGDDQPQDKSDESGTSD
jgi:hypothetical protein